MNSTATTSQYGLCKFMFATEWLLELTRKQTPKMGAEAG
jgi:hypothetical protein